MISICIPTYNDNPTALIDRLLKEIDLLDIKSEIILYDDCSTTPISINVERVQLIKGAKNQGSIHARKQLALVARYEHLLFMDADVMPKSVAFLSSYIECINNDYQIVFGGISYQENQPKSDGILRWTYGHKRESKSVKDREQQAYKNIISMGFMIRKNIMQDLCSDLEKTGYGGDIIFSSLINQRDIDVLHIDNPVVHLGLETASDFIKKSLRAIDTTYVATLEGITPEDFRPVQRTYVRISTYHLQHIIYRILGCIRPLLLANLKSKRPRIICLDFIKLHRYLYIQAGNSTQNSSNKEI